MSGRPILVSDHALERAAQRFPKLEHAELGALIRSDVASALLEGRLSCTKPRWLVRHGPRPKIHNGRVCWTAAEDRAFVLRRVHDDRRGHCWLVLSVLDARSQAGELA